VVLNQAGTLLTSNPSAQRILGLNAEQIEGRSIFDPMWQAIHEDGSPFLAADFPAAVSLRTGQPCHNVVMGLRQGATLRWLSVNSQPLFRGQETMPPAVVVSIEDVTAHKEMAAALAKSCENG
jgi:PAS domain S-box-containing protein